MNRIINIKFNYKLIAIFGSAILVYIVIRFALPKFGAVGWLLMSVLLFDGWLEYWIQKHKSQLPQRTCRLFLRIFYTSIFAFVLMILSFWVIHLAYWSPFLRVYGYGLMITVISVKITITCLLFFQFWISKIPCVKKLSSPKRWFQLGILTVVLLFSIALFGTVYEAFALRVHRVELRCKTVPKAFNDYTIVQFSDMHIGSQVWEFYVKRLVDSINAQNPDLVVYTGDMVNFHSEELTPFKALFSRIRAKDGVFVVLGNHDYGGYLDWKTPKDSIANIQRLKDIYHSMGWQVLSNEHVWFHRGEDSIVLAGVEHYNSPKSRRFKNLADTEKALQGVCSSNFIVMISHNPDHFSKELHASFPYVNLTLTGHSHGGQVKMRIGNQRFSVARLGMDYWRDFHQFDEQFLNVCTGSGFNALPFRINIPPSISVITLQPL